MAFQGIKAVNRVGSNRPMSASGARSVVGYRRPQNVQFTTSSLKGETCSLVSKKISPVVQRAKSPPSLLLKSRGNQPTAGLRGVYPRSVNQKQFRGGVGAGRPSQPPPIKPTFQPNKRFQVARKSSVEIRSNIPGLTPKVRRAVSLKTLERPSFDQDQIKKHHIPSTNRIKLQQQKILKNNNIDYRSRKKIIVGNNNESISRRIRCNSAPASERPGDYSSTFSVKQKCSIVKGISINLICPTEMKGRFIFPTNVPEPPPWNGYKKNYCLHVHICPIISGINDNIGSGWNSTSVPPPKNVKDAKKILRSGALCLACGCSDFFPSDSEPNRCNNCGHIHT